MKKEINLMHKKTSIFSFMTLVLLVFGGFTNAFAVDVTFGVSGGDNAVGTTAITGNQTVSAGYKITNIVNPNNFQIRVDNSSIVEGSTVIHDGTWNLVVPNTLAVGDYSVSWSANLAPNATVYLTTFSFSIVAPNEAPIIDGVPNPIVLAIEHYDSSRTGQMYDKIGQTFTWNTDKSLESVAIDPFADERALVFTVYEGHTTCSGTVVSQQNLTFPRTSFTFSPVRLNTPIDLVNGSDYTMCFVSQDGERSVLMRGTTNSFAEGKMIVSSTVGDTFSDTVDMFFQLNPPVPIEPLSNTIAENTTFAYDVNATDTEGDTITYSIADELDGSSFSIDAASGIINFVSAPDFETPSDSNVDNLYKLRVVAWDGLAENNVSLEITVTDVVLEGPINLALSTMSIDENNEVNATVGVVSAQAVTSSYTLTLNSATNNALFTIEGTNLIIKEVADFEAKTTYSVEVNATDSESRSTLKSFDIAVNDINEAPVWEVVFPTQSINEDNAPLVFDLNATDEDGDIVTYTINSVLGVATSFNGNTKELTLTPLANVNGVISLDFNATSNGQSTIQTVTLNIAAVNDAPTIDTTFTDKTVDEDSAVMVMPIAVGDVEGSDLNLTITSSDSTIVSISQNWNALVNQGDLLEFNLTLAPNANDDVTITVTVNDGELTTTESFDITINPVNDLPSLENLGDRVSYKNFGTKSIILEGADVDGDVLTYAYSMQDETIVDSVSLVDNNLTFISKQDAYGNSDINVTLSDGNITVSKLFNFYVAPIEDGDDVEKVGDIEIDENNESKTTTLSVDNELTVKKQEDVNGTVSHEVTLGAKTTSALSELVDSIVKILEDGVETSYTDTLNAIVAKVIATVLGEATHTLEVGGKITTATSKKAGAQTVIEKDEDNKTRIVTRIGNVEVTADANGTAHHKVGTTTATSQLQGATTTIFENGNVQTDVRETPTSTVRAVVVTQANGESTTSFISDSNVTRSMFTTPYVSGNNVTIELINGVLYIQTNATLDANLIVE